MLPSGHHHRPGVPLQKLHQPRRDLRDRRLYARIVHHVVRHAEAENHAHILIPRRVADPEISRRAVRINPVRSFFALNPGGVRGIQGNQAPRQQIRPGHVQQRLKSRDRLLYISQRGGRLGDLITKCFGRQIVPGPDSRIAATGIADDLVARRSGENRIENGPERNVRRLDIGGDAQRIGFRRVRDGHREPGSSASEECSTHGDRR